jgi:DNA helicase II / ATP-dependent DNA helicase PcrA
MINQTEQEEREYLEVIKEKLMLAIRRVDENVRQFSSELKQNKQYIHEHQSGMDEADMVAAGQSINRMAFTGESAVARKRKLLKLGSSPYFGRIDFKADSEDAHTPVYIGIYTFSDELMRANLIYDWRAHPYHPCFMILNWVGPGMKRLRVKLKETSLSNASTKLSMEGWSS